MEHGARTKLLSALVLAVVFGSGVLLGYASADAGRDPGEPVVAVTTDSASMRQRREPVYAQLATPEQRVVMDSIVRANRERINVLYEDLQKHRQEYEAAYDSTYQEMVRAITEVFPPDVREEYRRLLAESDRRRAEQGGSGVRK